MSRPKTAQELIHWLEEGAGARGVALAAVLAVTVALSLRLAWVQFHGPASEATLVQADMGRQLARGEGFTTLVNYPQASAASLVLFSAGPGEGKSTTLHRLVRIMAAGGERVILIDSDVRRPTQHRLADRPREPGLSEYMLNQKGLDEVIQKSIAPNLDFIPSGHAPGFTLGLLHLNRLKDLIATLRGRYDKIVFDSPPIIGVSDASVLASAVDGTVLLIQHRRNPQSMVVRAQQIVESLKAPLLGVVLNQVPLNSGDDYGYYTNNYSYYSEGSGQRRRSAAKSKSPGRGGDELKLS